MQLGLGDGIRLNLPIHLVARGKARRELIAGNRVDWATGNVEVLWLT